jgi:AAA+ ATPase superfamily predicted ATPase
MKYWNRLFRDERDVTDQIGSELEKIKAYADELCLEGAQKPIQESNDRHAVWLSNPRKLFPAAFLTPAVKAAIIIARQLEAKKRHDEAFGICNTFGEMCKVSIAYIKEESSRKQFEDLIFIACKAAFSEEQVDINLLRNHLKRFCDSAFGTFYLQKDRSFYPTPPKQRDTDREDSLINKAVESFFEDRLRQLLESDRPRVNDFVQVNMPIVYRNASLKDRERWEKLLTSAGCGDALHQLRDLGVLVNPDEVGIVSSDKRTEISRAASNNDWERVVELLQPSAKELEAFLNSECQIRFRFKQPALPKLAEEEHRIVFAKVQKLSQTDESEKLNAALKMANEVWQENIDNLEVRGWVAFLCAKTGNLPRAVDLLVALRDRQSKGEHFATCWNLAALLYDRKTDVDIAEAYNLVRPLLREDTVDEDLIYILLALSLKLNDTQTFLSAIPQVLSLQFHPLAIVVAHKAKEKERMDDLIGQILKNWQGGWELPSVKTQFARLEDFESTVNKARVEGQIEQLITWLRARINNNKKAIHHYRALARVFENEVRDFKNAFSTLEDACDVAAHQRPPDEKNITDLCRDLLELAKRSKQNDLGRQAYLVAKQHRADEALLRSFQAFAPQEEKVLAKTDLEQNIPSQPKPTPNIPARDPQLAERFASVTRHLDGIRTVSSYVEQVEVIEMYQNIVVELNPSESPTPLALIRNITDVFTTFSQLDEHDHDGRHSLYDRVGGFEKRLNQLLGGETMSQHLIDVLTPYCHMLKQVLSDFSIRAGVGPMIDISIENRFISLEGNRSTLVIRLINTTARLASNVCVELVIESSALSIVGRREWSIAQVEPQASCLLNIPIERKRTSTPNNADRLVFTISLHASAEGFPNMDLGIIKKELPIKTLQEAIGTPIIPKLFEIGHPLNPDRPELFQGRIDSLNAIKASFYGGVQRARYFLDGIRRAGKTSILNFIPSYLPDTVIVTRVNIEKFYLHGQMDSYGVLRQLCAHINDSFNERSGQSLSLPDESAFAVAPAKVFESFLNEIKIKHGLVPLLVFDEFQELLEAIAKSNSSKDRDTRVLDILRANLEEGRVFGIFTGSVRFDRLSQILPHRIFGSLVRLRVSFLTKDSVSEVLRAGMQQWANLLPETIDRVFELTGGYPWLVQTYGAGIVDQLNSERRTVATPEDVNHVTEDAVLCNDELFKFWWPTDQLGTEEEHFIEWLFRKYPKENEIATREFFADVSTRDQMSFRRAFENLRACEVLDSTQIQHICFRGAVLRDWLERQLQDGQLRIHKNAVTQETVRGQAGIFIDHENLIHKLKEVSVQRGVKVPTNMAERFEWFDRVFKHLLAEAERRFGKLHHKVAVAFWERSEESELQTIYHQHGFDIRRPEDVKIENAVDFKLADEVRRKGAVAEREGSRLSHVIIVTGDGDFSHAVRGLVQDGVVVQIWGGAANTSRSFQHIVGAENVLAIDDVCGL